MRPWIIVVSFLLMSFSFSHTISAEEAVEAVPVEDTIEEISQEPQVDLQTAKALSIKLGTKLYKDPQLTTEYGEWTGTKSINEFTVNNEIISLTVAGIKLYMPASEVTLSDEFEEKKASAIGYVRFPAQAIIYSEANKNAPLLTMKGNQSQQVEVTGVVGNFYRVEVAGITGYVLKNETSVDVKQPLKVLEKTAIMQGTKKVATFVENGVIKVSSVKGNTYTFNKSFTFTSNSVIEAPIKMSWPKAAQQTYKITLTAQKATGLYEAEGQKIAEIPAKTKIELVNIRGKYGIVNMLGSTVYVDLKDFKHINMIAGEKILTHHEMNYKLQVFAMMYPEFMKLEEIGKSVEGRSIMALTVGTGKKQILMDGAMHAREHMTTNVLMEMIDNYSYHYVHNSKFAGYNVRNVLDKVSIAFVPMINPDGVTLVQGGKVSTPRSTLIKLNGGSTNFKRWKANIRGIDLNRNWDVRWHKLPKIAPKWEMAKGQKPFSEPETIALRDFVLKHPFKAYITYHSSGQIMFWEYGDDKGGKAKATALVRDLSKTTGYAIMKNSQTSPTAASEPWVGKKKNAPAVTMEIAPYAGNGPVPLSRWSSVWKKNQSVGLLVANKAKGY